MTNTAKARYRDLARKRYGLEERAEGEVLALRRTMDEIRDLDDLQRREAHAAGEVADFTPAGTVLSGWIGDRLGGPGGYAGLVQHLEHESTLAERDRMAKKP